MARVRTVKSSDQVCYLATWARANDSVVASFGGAAAGLGTENPNFASLTSFFHPSFSPFIVTLLDLRYIRVGRADDKHRSAVLDAFWRLTFAHVSRLLSCA